MKVKVNQDACIGCGACLSIAEDLFELNEDGLSHAKVEEVPEDKQDQAKEAIESCPTGAIEEE
ncbi:MAG: ferredoxin [Bacilli bacterium]|nr:ferredoxin [Bacilli bacterium]